MADVNALFQEVSKLSKADAKSLKEMLEAKMPKSEPKAKKGEDKKADSDAASEESAS